MARVAAFIFLIVAVAIISTTMAQICPQNQEWTTCGTACPPSCRNSDPRQACTLECKIGCQCKEGYLLHSSGNCVTPTECLIQN